MKKYGHKAPRQYTIFYTLPPLNTISVKEDSVTRKKYASALLFTLCGWSAVNTHVCVFLVCFVALDDYIIKHRPQQRILLKQWVLHNKSVPLKSRKYLLWNSCDRHFKLLSGGRFLDPLLRRKNNKNKKSAK